MSMLLDPSDILNARILIVDDQKANADLLLQLLNKVGYTAVTATDKPSEVFALHRKHHYDLILLDLQMPEMDGFQVIEGLKTNKADPYLPVIVLTAQAGHKLKALLAGAKDFLSKPFDLVEVETRIHNMLEVRLLYRKLEDHNRLLEIAVQERTAELRESEARYRCLTELATDWYWEQDESGKFIKLFGPVLDMLGIRVEGFVEAQGEGDPHCWDAEEREVLKARIAAREPFLDMIFTRIHADGSRRQFQVSGEPMFSHSNRYVGYRGIGVELTRRR